MVTDHRADGRRLGESLVGAVAFTELMAQRRLGETIRDVERRLLAFSSPGASSTAPGEPKPDTPIVFTDEDLRAT